MFPARNLAVCRSSEAVFSPLRHDYLCSLRAASLDYVDPVGLGQDVERLAHLMVDDPSGIDVEPSKERLVQNRPDRFVTMLIGGMGGFQKRQGVAEDVSSLIEVVPGLGQRLLDLAAFLTDDSDLRPERVFRPALLGCQVEEVVLLAVQGVQTPGVLLTEGVAEAVMILEGYSGRPVEVQADYR